MKLIRQKSLWGKYKVLLRANLREKIFKTISDALPNGIEITAEITGIILISSMLCEIAVGCVKWVMGHRIVIKVLEKAK